MGAAAQWAAVTVAGVALVVSALSFATARQVRRESGWYLRAGRKVWRAGPTDDEWREFAVTLMNAGRAEVEILGVSLLFRPFGSRPAFHNYSDSRLPGDGPTIAGGRSKQFVVEHVLRDDDRRVDPGDGQWALLEVELGTGRTVRRLVRCWNF
jgi:hypothetical protein